MNIVVSQSITIQLMQYFWCVHINVTKHANTIFYHCFIHPYLPYHSVLVIILIFSFIVVTIVTHPAVSEYLLILLKQSDWIYVLDVYILILKFVLVISCLRCFIFFWISPILPFEFVILIVSSFVGNIVVNRVVSSLNMIRLIRYYWCVNIYAKSRTYIIFLSLFSS